MTGAEFCNAYTELGVQVTVVASRDQILPHEDSRRRRGAGGGVRRTRREAGQERPRESVTRTADGVRVSLADGRTVEGSHALMTVGSVPNTAVSGWSGSVSS